MKHIVWVLLLSLGVCAASAQEVYTSSGKPGYQKKMHKTKKGYDPEKLILGGGIGAGFGGGFVNVGVSPIVGYRFTKNFQAGLGIGYAYYQEPEYVNPNNQYAVSYAKENLVYPNVWARYFVYRNFFVDGTLEYDIISRKYPGYDINNPAAGPVTIKDHPTNTSLLLGAGIRQPLGGRVSAYIELVYDILQGTYSQYPIGAPDIRFGIATGL